MLLKTHSALALIHAPVYYIGLIAQEHVVALYCIVRLESSTQVYTMKQIELRAYQLHTVEYSMWTQFIFGQVDLQLHQLLG